MLVKLLFLVLLGPAQAGSPAGEEPAAAAHCKQVPDVAALTAAPRHSLPYDTGIPVQAQPAPPQQAAAADAYLDEDAREMVRLARLRRQTADRSITAYQALARERVSAGLGLGAQDRLLFRSETASRVDWRFGGPVSIEVLGARSVVPIADPELRVPGDLRQTMVRIAFDPVESQLLVVTRNSPLRNPLAENAEAHYRFASGDGTTITLPDGRIVRLRELRILPRRPDPDLIAGSFWLDLDTHSVVRAIYRLSRPLELPLPIIGEMRADLDYFTVDYGYWDLRWWLPQQVSASGFLQIGILRLPLHYELNYAEYAVQGGGAVPVDAPAPQACRQPVSVRLETMPGVQLDSADARRRAEADNARVARLLRSDSTFKANRAQRDSAAAVRRAAADGAGEEEARAAGRAAAEAARRNWRELCDWEFLVLVPDQAALLESEWLPGSIFDPGPAFSSEAELRGLVERLKQLAPPPWQLVRPSFNWGFARYNRVEGLSLGVGARLDLGRLMLDASARAGTAEPIPFVELGVKRRTRRGGLRLAGYRRLALAEPATRAFGFGNSLNAVVLGRDDGDYFRALGVELVGSPPSGARQWYDWRVHIERQAPVEQGTQFSVRRSLFDKDHVFRDNISADNADQLGASLRLRKSRGLDPLAFRWSAEWRMDAAAGSFEFVRPGLMVQLGSRLTSRLVGSLELAGGTSAGKLPVQSLWYLGGPTSLRGYPAAVASGEAFWRGRAAVATALPAARVEIFSDAGWAGPRADFTTRNPLHSVGAGATFLDGVIRLDIGRALREPVGWRTDLYIDARR